MSAISKRSTAGWIVFSVLWGFLFVVATVFGGMACSAGDGGTPAVAAGSPLDDYCDTVDAGLSGNNVLLWIAAALMVVLGGILAVRTGQRRLARAIGVALVVACFLHMALSLALPAS
jgi:hypothetical protein